MMQLTYLKMVLFHIAAIGWISPQTGYKIYKVAYLHKTEPYR